MKIKEIIEKLCSHEISKNEAINLITEITDGFRKNNALEFIIEEYGTTTHSDSGYLKLILPYQYSKMKGKVKNGDKVDVVFIP
jgi:hypothetical protein